MSLIAVNSVLEWIDKESQTLRNERVLWIDPDKGEAIVIELFDTKAVPEVKTMDIIQEALTNGDVVKKDIDPYFYYANSESVYLQKYASYRDKAWDLIKNLVEDEPDIYIPKIRFLLVGEVAEANRVQKRTVLKYLRKYWQGGKTKNALLPSYDKCGAPNRERKVSNSKRGRPSKLSQILSRSTGVNVDENVKSKFEMGFGLFYRNKSNMPLTKAFELTLERFFNLGFQNTTGENVPIMPPASELPNYFQFYYWVITKKHDLEKTIIAREGKRNYLLKSRPVLGDSTKMALGPGSIYQIDATLVDLYLVSSFDRSLIIGRPVLYVVVDVFSRMVVGFYVGLEGPSALAAKMALANSATDKTNFLSEYGISDFTGDLWPCGHLPEAILADRGEMEGKEADMLVASLGITVLTTPPYRADWKGIVEQQFRLINLSVVHWLPGAVKQRFRQRGEPDHRLDAKLDLHEFTKILIYKFIEYNTTHLVDDYPLDEYMIQEHIKPNPLELWEWGINHKYGHLREITPDALKIALMPRDTATITLNGIRFQGMFYSCELALRDQWFQKARAKGTWKVDIAYDPRNTDSIHLLLNDGKAVETCMLLENESLYKKRRLEEVLDLFAIQQQQKLLHQEPTPQQKANINAKVNAIVKEGAEKTAAVLANASVSKTQRLKNIKKNRAQEKVLLAGKTNPEPLSTKGKSESKPIEDVLSEMARSREVRLLNMLKEQSEE